MKVKQKSAKFWENSNLKQHANLDSDKNNDETNELVVKETLCRLSGKRQLN